MGALGFQFVSPEAARVWVNEYYVNLTQRLDKLADYPTNPNIAMVSAFMCAPTDEEAQAKAAGWTFFVFCLSHYGRHGMAEPGRGDMWELYQEWRETPKAQETLRAGLIGSPETIRRRLREFEAAHVDQVILLNQTGRTPHEDICASLELFAREVMPEFHDREADQRRWKSQVLEGRIALEQLRHFGAQDLCPPERGHRAAHAGRAQAQDGRQRGRRRARRRPGVTGPRPSTRWPRRP